MTVVHQDLDGSVIVKISGSYAMAVEGSSDARAGIERDVAESAVVLVPVQNLAFAECVVETSVIKFRVDVTVCHENVGPAVVVDVEEESPPSQELGILAKSGGRCDIRKCSVVIVAIKRRRVVGEIRFDDVEPSVAIVVDRIGAHAGLLAASVVEGYASLHGGFGEGAIAVVVKEQAGRGIAGDINIGPAVIFKVAGEYGEAEIGIGLCDSRSLAYVGESAVAVVVVELAMRPFQAAWTAHHRHPL